METMKFLLQNRLLGSRVIATSDHPNVWLYPSTRTKSDEEIGLV